jgi:hypothetical protein
MKPRRSPVFTSAPDPRAPSLFCPRCVRPLVYRHTEIAGVEPIERWDYYECRACGGFRYRQRTKKLVPTRDLRLKP